jgi:hypothetical protein
MIGPSSSIRRRLSASLGVAMTPVTLAGDLDGRTFAPAQQ